MNPLKLVLEKSCLSQPCLILSTKRIEFQWILIACRHGQDFIIHRLVNVTCHGGPSFYMLEMIKHNPFIFQIITKLHLFNQINITINIIINKHFDLTIVQENNYLECSCNNF